MVKDSRYPRDAYHFIREALDFTQKLIGKENMGKVRHVTPTELLDGIRQHALLQFGPMTVTVPLLGAETMVSTRLLARVSLSVPLSTMSFSTPAVAETF